MELLSEPRRPSTHPAVMFAPYLERYREWSPFVVSWTKGAIPGTGDLEAAAS